MHTISIRHTQAIFSSTKRQESAVQFRTDMIEAAPLSVNKLKYSCLADNFEDFARNRRGFVSGKLVKNNIPRPRSLQSTPSIDLELFLDVLGPSQENVTLNCVVTRVMTSKFAEVPISRGQ